MVKKIKVVSLTDENFNESEAMGKIVEEMKNEKKVEPSEAVEPMEPVVMKKKPKIQAIKKIADEIIVEPLEAVEPMEPVVMKKKPKPKTQAIKKIADEIVVNFDSHKNIDKVEVEEIEDQPKEVEEKPKEVENKNIKTTELVKCPDCEKMLTLKSLKYSHKKNCSGNKEEVIIHENKIEKKQPAIKEKPEGQTEQIMPYKLNSRNERMMLRIRKIENLASQAF